jgi:endonuclease G
MKKSSLVYHFGKALLISLTLISFSVFAKDSECPQFYPNQKPIQPFNGTELCNVFYVTQYDVQNRKALFSSELLSPGPHNVKRTNAFKADKRTIKPVTPEEYVRSGFDRGHLTPADDAVTVDEMLSTFLMTNMTPQNPKLNRGPWKKLENAVRSDVTRSGDKAIVVTGAFYAGGVPILPVPVPSGYFKIVYIKNQKPYAFYADNNDRSAPHPVQISWINAQSNLKFPTD